MTVLTQDLTALAGQFVIAENQITATPAGGPVQLCMANPLRWALLMSASTAGVHPGKPQWVSTQMLNPGNANGLVVLTDDTVFENNYRQYGGLIQVAWWTQEFGIGANVVWTVIEVLCQQ